MNFTEVITNTLVMVNVTTHLTVPVKAGLDYIRIFYPVQLNVPDTEVKTGAP